MAKSKYSPKSEYSKLLIECIYCKEYKSENYFYKDKSKSNGRKPRCKPCDFLSVNKQRRARYEKEYWTLRREERRAMIINSHNKNKDHHKQKRKKYLKTSAGAAKHVEDGAIRRARLKEAFIEKIDYLEVYNCSNKSCHYCHKSLNIENVEFDHYIPISKGGIHAASNIRISCSTCNRKKGAKMPAVMEAAYQMV